MCVETEPVWGNKRACQLLTDALDRLFEQTALLESTKLSDEEFRAGISSPLRQIVLPAKNITSLKQVLPKFTSNDYVQSKFGFYTTLKDFTASRRCIQLVRKVKFPVPIHLLDNLIISVNVKEHLFPAHLNVVKRQLRFLDSSNNYSAREYTRQEMLMWKFYRLAWTVHVHID